MMSVVSLIVCVALAERVAAEIGGAPINIYYNPNAFTGFVVTTSLLLALFIGGSAYIRYNTKPVEPAVAHSGTDASTGLMDSSKSTVTNPLSSRSESAESHSQHSTHSVQSSHSHH